MIDCMQCRILQNVGHCMVGNNTVDLVNFAVICFTIFAGDDDNVLLEGLPVKFKQ